MKVHHLGVAVESLAHTVPVFETLLGQKAGPVETVAEQKVRVASFRVGESRLELLEGTSEDSPVARFISKRGQGIHHVALTVPDLADTLRTLERQGFRLIDRAPRVGAGGERIAFVHPASVAGVLMELIEEP